MSRTFRIWVPVALLLFCTAPVFAQKAQWAKAYTWQGKGSQQTPIFFVTTDKWRVVYRPKGKGPFQVVLNDESQRKPQTITDQKGYPLSAGRKGLRDMGRYFLTIAAPDAEWELVVEQHLTPIQEWHLRQLAKKEAPKLDLLATYAGEAGEEEFEIEVPRGSWKLFTHVEGAGKLDVAITRTGDDSEVLNLTDLSAGDSGTWVHQSGTYTLRTKAADGCLWKLYVCATK